MKAPGQYLETHDTRVRQGGLVQIVEPVDEAQEGHQIAVDLADELLLVLGGHGDDLAIGEDFECLIGIVGVCMLQGDRADFRLVDGVHLLHVGREARRVLLLDIGHACDALPPLSARRSTAEMEDKREES